jgi:spore germination cell wall hydrolase CwlJ-like protein
MQIDSSAIWESDRMIIKPVHLIAMFLGSMVLSMLITGLITSSVDAVRVVEVEVEREPIVIVEPDPIAVRCLARVVYGEARSDSIEGQRAVAWAALNRTVDGRWPSSVCLVAVQKGQFALAPQTVERDAWETSLAVARQVLIDRHNREPDPTNGAVFFAHVKPGQTLPWTHGKDGLKISHHTFWK